MRFPPDVETVEDIPDEFAPGPLMSRQSLIDGILTVVPDADFSNPAWGKIEGPGYSIEVNVGDDDPVESFGFNVRGGDLADVAIADILDHLELRAIDESSGDFFDRQASVESLQGWRAHRDRVIGTPST
jgi:hypothetical protein